MSVALERPPPPQARRVTPPLSDTVETPLTQFVQQTDQGDIFPAIDELIARA